MTTKTHYRTTGRPIGSLSPVVRPAYTTEKGRLIDADLYDEIVKVTGAVCDLMFTDGISRRQRRAVSKAYHALRSITPKVNETRDDIAPF